MTFYFGDSGYFDNLAKEAIWVLKKKHPHIESILVIAYLGSRIDFDKIDGFTFPGVDYATPETAVQIRDEWLMRESDTIISGVIHESEATTALLKFAAEMGKRIINYLDRG